MHRFCVTVNVQDVLPPEHLPFGVTVGWPQQVALAVPGAANGVTETGTHTVALWHNRGYREESALQAGPQIVRPVAVVFPP